MTPLSDLGYLPIRSAEAIREVMPAWRLQVSQVELPAGTPLPQALAPAGAPSPPRRCIEPCLTTDRLIPPDPAANGHRPATGTGSGLG
jgi:hypothetical protein